MLRLQEWVACLVALLEAQSVVLSLVWFVDPVSQFAVPSVRLPGLLAEALFGVLGYNLWSLKHSPLSNLMHEICCHSIDGE